MFVCAYKDEGHGKEILSQSQNNVKLLQGFQQGSDMSDPDFKKHSGHQRYCTETISAQMRTQVLRTKSQLKSASSF